VCGVYVRCGVALVCSAVQCGSSGYSGTSSGGRIAWFLSVVQVSVLLTQ
jgi:hypothetical protein